MDEGRDDATAGEGSAERALARIADARRRGATGAAQLADQLLRGVAGQGGEGGSTAGAADATSTLRRTRRGVEIAVEGALEALRDAADTVDGLLLSDTPHSSGIESLEISAAPATEARTTIWIHNQTHRPSAPLELRLTDLTNLAGQTLDTKGWFEPGSLPSIDQGQSSNSVLCLTPSVLAEKGEYHGLVLIVGADRLEPLHIKISVEDDP